MPDMRRTSIRLHVLLPTIAATEAHPELLSNPRGFLEAHFYGGSGIIANCAIRGDSRSIGFCCKPTGGRLHVIDLPTTLLASQKTAQKVLDIKADDAIEKDHLSRLLAKEIDLFRNTLAQFLFTGEDCAYHVTQGDAESFANKIFIDEIAFEELHDREGIPWFFANSQERGNK